MELQELQERWLEQERRLEENQALTLQLARGLRADQTKGALRRLFYSGWIELIMDLAFLVILVSYITEVLWQPRYSLPAIILLGLSVAMTSLLVRQLHLLHGLDYSAPVVKLQRELERLKILRVTEVKWILLLSPALWPPIFVVFTHGILGLDPYLLVNATWLLVNVLFGIIASALLWGLAHYVSRRHSESPWLVWLRRNMAGEQIKAAENVLAQYTAFERE
jgi:hypothetical protein